MKAKIDSYGGTTGAKLVDTSCVPLYASWPGKDLLPTLGGAEQALVFDDGTSKLDITVPLAISAKLATPTVRLSGDFVTLVIETGAGEGTVSAGDAKLTGDGDGFMMGVVDENVTVEGHRLTVRIPTKDLSAKGYRLEAVLTFATTLACAPPRKTPPNAPIAMKAMLPFTVTR